MGEVKWRTTIPDESAVIPFVPEVNERLGILSNFGPYRVIYVVTPWLTRILNTTGGRMLSSTRPN